MFFPIGELPEPVRKHLEEVQAHQRMHTQDNTHAVKQFFESLNAEQLEALVFLLNHCHTESNVAYFLGRIEMLLQMKFGKCPCGENHDDFPFDETHGPNMPEQMRGKPIEDTELPDQVVAYPGQMLDKERQMMHDREAFDERPALMAEYGVEANPKHGGDLIKDGPIVASPFRCANCGIGIASLEDRMRRPKGIEGCSGCQQKSAWG